MNRSVQQRQVRRRSSRTRPSAPSSSPGKGWLYLFGPLIPVTILRSVIVIAVVGNAAEHWVSVYFAVKNKIGLSVNIAVGSAAQIPLFADEITQRGESTWYHGQPLLAIYAVLGLTFFFV